MKVGHREDGSVDVSFGSRLTLRLDEDEAHELARAILGQESPTADAPEIPAAAKSPAPSPAEVASTMAPPPVPRPRPVPHDVGEDLRISEDARVWMDRLGFIDDDVEAAVFDPDDSWPIPGRGSLMCSTHGAIAVFAYMESPPKVVSVKPSQNVHRPAGVSSRRGGGGSHRASKKFESASEMVQELKSRGFTVSIANGGHYRVEHVDSDEVMPLPVSPSDHRWSANAVREIKSRFGTDISRPREEKK